MHVKVDWQHSADDLKRLYHAERDGKRRQRLHDVLWQVRTGSTSWQQWDAW